MYVCMYKLTYIFNMYMLKSILCVYILSIYIYLNICTTKFTHSTEMVLSTIIFISIYAFIGLSVYLFFFLPVCLPINFIEDLFINVYMKIH